jgi:hypothetical protein
VWAGTISPNEVKSSDGTTPGTIPHALAINLPKNIVCPDRMAFPAQRHDGTSTDLVNCIPEGAQLRLPATFNFTEFKDPTDGSPKPPLATDSLVKAAMKYGLIVRDSTASFPILFFRDTLADGQGDQYVDDSLGAYNAFNHNTKIQISNAFPWAQLQVVAMKICPGSIGPCDPPA